MIREVLSKEVTKLRPKYHEELNQVKVWQESILEEEVVEKGVQMHLEGTNMVSGRNRKDSVTRDDAGEGIRKKTFS